MPDIPDIVLGLTVAAGSKHAFSGWRNVRHLAMHRASIEDCDQTARMRGLIRVFNGHTCQLEPFALLYYSHWYLFCRLYKLHAA